MTRKWIVPVAVSSLLLLLFFWFKVARFQALYYTYNDMYIFLQSSCSWMDGRPLLYENIWGYDDRIHNNYAMLLWGPLIHYMGAYGAFAVQTGLTLISYTLLIPILTKRLSEWASWLIISVLLLSPVWIWFNDHPGIGWHPELTYFPSSLLFLLALLKNRTGLLVMAGLLLVLVKEDGALLAGVLHVTYLSITYLRENPRQTAFSLLATRRFWLVTGGWAALFLAGMLLLAYKNSASAPEPRLQQALAVFAGGIHDAAFVWKHLLLLAKTALLLLPAVAMLLYGLHRSGWRQAGSILLVYGVGLLALLLSNLVQGATYYGTNDQFELVSLTWPPRFVLVYALSVFTVLTVWLQAVLDAARRRPVPVWQPALLGVVLVVGQWLIIPAVRPDFRPYAILHDLIRRRYDPEKAWLLPTHDLAVINRLARTIPPHSNVFIFDFLVPIFHKHYNIWPTEKQWVNADLAIIPTNDFQQLGKRLPRVMNPAYRAIRLSAYTIYVTPAYEMHLAAAMQTDDGKEAQATIRPAPRRPIF